MTYKLFLDDYRDPPKGDWVIVRSYEQFCAVIEKQGLPEVISFDHDLSDEHYFSSLGFGIEYDKYLEKTGYDCAKWLIQYCFSRALKLPSWRVHSMNPVGADNILNLLADYEKNYLVSRSSEHG